jgi:DMSO reductase family type II enzyme chaperone
MMELTDATAAAYSFFAQAFAYPDRAFWDRVTSDEDSSWLGAISARLPFRALLDLDLGQIDVWEELESSYLNHFLLAEAGAVPCPLYEGLISTAQPRTEVFMDVLRCYEYFGIRLGGETRELPDHLAVELEFMAFLAQKEAQVREASGNFTPLCLAQRDYLRRHLLAWVPDLNRRIQRSAVLPLYKELGSELVAFLERHCEHMQAVAEKDCPIGDLQEAVEPTMERGGGLHDGVEDHT